MSERTPVETLEELGALDERDMMHGYLAGFRGAPEPSIEMNRDYWHGWRNGMVDGGHMPKDSAQAILAHAYVEQQRARNDGRINTRNPVSSLFFRPKNQ